MRRMFTASAMVLTALCLLFFTGHGVRGGILQTLPLSGYASGIDGNNVVGGANGFGFLYDGITTSTIRPPGATFSTAFGIAGNRIVGTYDDSTGTHGFLFDGVTYTKLDNPLAIKGTIAAGIDGNNIVGWYNDAKNVPHGFLYDGSIFTTIDSPLGVNGTKLWGISGLKIVGNYMGTFSKQGSFIYDGSSFTNLSDPSGVALAYDIEGSNIVGSVSTTLHLAGFINDGTTYTHPFGIGEGLPGLSGFDYAFRGISGNKVVGYYNSFPSALPHPIIYTIPEPSSFCLTVFGAVFLGGGVLVRWFRRTACSRR